MAQEQQAIPESIRKVFEQYGVIKRVAVPKLDLLDKAISDRKGDWEVRKGGRGVSVALVTMQGQTFEGVADEANLALSSALSKALLGTQPQQLGFDDEPVDPESGELNPDPYRVKSVTLTGPNSSVTLTSDTRDIIDAGLRRFHAREDIELDPDVTPMASGLIPDPAPELVVERTLRAAGIPVRYDADSGLYRNPLGDAYASGWAEQEAGIQARRIGFAGSRS